MRFLLDEDLNPEAAKIARGLDLDAVSVHEIDRRGFSDEDQLRYSIRETRIFVTRNRDDFLRLVIAFYQSGEPLTGVLIVPYSLPNHRPDRIAHALKRWHEEQEELGGAELQGVDFLSP